MNLIIIIVNYKTADMLIRCLESLESLIRAQQLHIIISDNCSPDNSVFKLSQFIEEQDLQELVTLLELPENGGFSYGNNAAIKSAMEQQADVDYFWLLNPDTIVSEANLSNIEQLFAAQPKAGIIGTKQISIESGEQVSAAFNMLSPLTEFLLAAKNGYLFRAFSQATPSAFQAIETSQCDWVSGASFFVRRELLDNIGLMDEHFFLYFEEIDFCLRANKAGWQVWYEPSVSIVHEDNSSTGVHTVTSRRPAFWYDSRRYFYLKHYGVWGLIRADLGWLVGRMSLLTRKMLGMRANLSADPQRYMHDLLLGDLRYLTNALMLKLRLKE